MRPAMLVTACCVVVAFAMPVRTLAEPHVRDGFFLGVGFGGGSASVGWYDDRRVEWSGTINARAGHAIDTHLVLGAEVWYWAKDYEIARSDGDVPVELRFTAGTLAATWFPDGGGFFVRAGAGLAVGHLNALPPAGSSFPETAERDTGIAALAAMGYEFRITEEFALGAEGDFVYMGVSSGAIDTVIGYDVNAQLNWYW